MSGVIILTPVIAAAAWPGIITAATAVLAAMGYTAVSTTAAIANETAVTEQQQVELELTNQETVGATLGREEELIFVKDDIRVVFSRDVRGRMRVCVSGEGHAKAELEQLGRDLAGQIIQQFTYNRVITELQKRTSLSIVDQAVDEDRTIHIKLRSWEE